MRTIAAILVLQQLLALMSCRLRKMPLQVGPFAVVRSETLLTRLLEANGAWGVAALAVAMALGPERGGAIAGWLVGLFVYALSVWAHSSSDLDRAAPCGKQVVADQRSSIIAGARVGVIFGGTASLLVLAIAAYSLAFERLWAQPRRAAALTHMHAVLARSYARGRPLASETTGPLHAPWARFAGMHLAPGTSESATIKYAADPDGHGPFADWYSYRVNYPMFLRGTYVGYSPTLFRTADNRHLGSALCGPDGDSDLVIDASADIEDLVAVTYDPTNGVISNGDALVILATAEQTASRE